MVRKGWGLDESATTTMPRFFKAEWIGWGFMYNKKRERKMSLLQRVVLIFLLVMLFGFVMTAAVSAYGGWGWEYSEEDYYDWEEEYEEYKDDKEDDELRYYDYRRGEYVTIPEPDPWGSSYGYAPDPISIMMPLFIIFFMIVIPWIALWLALGTDK